MSSVELVRGDDFDYPVEFADRIPEGLTISSCAVSARHLSRPGGSVDGVLPSGTAPVVGSVASVRLAYAAAHAGEDFAIDLVATLSNSRTIGWSFNVSMDE